MKPVSLKKKQVSIFAVLLSMVFLLSATRQDLKNETKSTGPGDEKLKISWQFDSGG